MVPLSLLLKSAKDGQVERAYLNDITVQYRLRDSNEINKKNNKNYSINNSNSNNTNDNKWRTTKIPITNSQKITSNFDRWYFP